MIIQLNIIIGKIKIIEIEEEDLIQLVPKNMIIIIKNIIMNIQIMDIQILNIKEDTVEAYIKIIIGYILNQIWIIRKIILRIT
jgi:hypothetical protein